MKTIRSVKELRTELQSLKNEGKRISFVPTMGALHEGHMALVKKAQAETDCVVVSVFVNPTQFNDPKDFEKYPTELDSDTSLCASHGVSFLFRPNAAEIYPDHFTYQVQETSLSTQLCGQFRPGHFQGMLTVVLKLLNIVQAHRAYFGEKDFQQLELVRGMTKAFFLDTEIVACPTIREQTGLALSSRNARLSEEQRKFAAQLSQVMKASLTAQECAVDLSKLGFQVEYVEDVLGRRLAAVRLGEVRLIDNVELNQKWKGSTYDSHT